MGNGLNRQIVVERIEQALGRVDGLVVRRDVALERLTTLRVGGPVDLLVEAATESALCSLLEVVAAEEADLLLLGLGSNVLAPDDGLRAIACRLVGEFRCIDFDHGSVRAGGAVPLAQLARKSAERGLVGLEALAGFPSTVGGAVCMNAGSYGTEIKDVLVEARGLERDGRVSILGLEDLRPGYRSTTLQSGTTIVTSAVFALETGDRRAALERIAALNRRRRSSLPSGRPSAGSVFRNPDGDSAGRLLDQCGLKGTQRGGARISSKHANVIVNTGGARAEDVLGLMVEGWSRVRARFAVALEPELVLLGALSERWQELTGQPHEGV